MSSFISTNNDYFFCILGNYLSNFKHGFVDHLIEFWPSKNKNFSLLVFLKYSSLFKVTHLSDFSSQDFLSFTKRFSLFYQFTSLCYYFFVRVFIQIRELDVLPTIQKVYPAITWLEREVWDFFGIYFSNHSNLWRILNDYGFLGYPLRKDFPLTGFLEVFYDDFKGRLVKVAVELSQEYRKHIYLMVWKEAKLIN